MKGKKYDTGKTKYHLIPPECTKARAEILTFGATKYGEDNRQGLDDFDNRFYNATMRHLQAWRMGELIDPESGKLHLAHVGANIDFLLWKALNKGPNKG